jgi:hypothetical protein
MAAVAVEQAAEIAGRAEHLGHLGARHVARVRIVVAGLKKRRLPLELRGMGGLVGGIEDAGLEVAGDRMTRDPFLEERLGVLAELP